MSVAIEDEDEDEDEMLDQRDEVMGGQVLPARTCESANTSAGAQWNAILMTTSSIRLSSIIRCHVDGI